MGWWMRRNQRLATLALIYLGLSVAIAAEPSTEPILRIEAGMHTAKLSGIASDRAGRYAVTASDDKTARVWDVASGRLLRVLRPPIGEGNEGKLSAVAMTSDGRVVATAGWADSDSLKRGHLYLFDSASGRLKRRIADLPGGVHSLAFSPDGRWLAAALGGSNGLRVWDWRANSAALADSDVKGQSFEASWSATDNRLATTNADGHVYLYTVQPDKLTKVARAVAPGGRRPMGIAFSPDADELAVGYGDSTRVDIFDSKRLTHKFRPSSAGTTDGNLSRVAWSADGRVLFAAGRGNLDERFSIRRWPRSGRGAPVDVPTVGETVMQLVALPTAAGGGVLVGGSEPAWGVLDAAGSWRPRQAPPIANFSGIHPEFRLSDDGHELQFGFESLGNAPYRFALASRLLQSGSDDKLAPPRTEGLPDRLGKRKVRATRDADQPTPSRTEGLPARPGKRRARPERTADHRAQVDQREERFGVVAGIPSYGGVVRGARNWFGRFDADGKELWRLPIPGVVWGVNVPASGKLVVAAYDDGTIRWHRLSDGQELLALFPHADRKRWVLWTPSGYYDASVGGENLIGWHLNRGAESAADFFPASRLRDRYFRPDIIDRVLDTLDEERAVAIADTERGTSIAQQLQAGFRNVLTAWQRQQWPPVVELVSPAEVAASQPQLTLRYRTRSAAEAPVTAVRVRVNGQAQPIARNLEAQATDAEDLHELTVNVPAQDSQIQLFAENRLGVSTPVTVNVTWVGTTEDPAAVPATADTTGLQIQPRLYLLAIGVSNYQHADINKLSFAAKDARDFTQAMQRQQGKLYSAVEVKLVTEAAATRDNIADALDWLQRQVTQHDVGMLFLSGHGYNDPGMGYTYLPVNADPDKLKRTGVTMADIKSTLNSIAGKAVAFLDTCHSGNVFGPAQKAAFNDISGVINELASAENGVVVFSSSTGRQLSLEDEAWDNGAFTKALVEGIDGKADTRQSGRVTFKMLDLYVTDRVKELTKGTQSPVTQAPGGVNDFPLAVLAR